MTSFKCAFGHSYYYNKFVPLWYTLAAHKARHSPAKIPMARPNKPDFAPKLPRGTDVYTLLKYGQVIMILQPYRVSNLILHDSRRVATASNWLILNLGMVKRNANLVS